MADHSAEPGGAGALARLAVDRHMGAMSGRPCNPGSDLRQLWQVLLGDTPFPQCGTDDTADRPHEGDTASDTKPPLKPDRASSDTRRDR